VNRGRQRAWVPVVTGLVVLAGLGLSAGCEARSSVEAAQTAVVAAQTVLPAAQSTAQAGATLVAGIVTDVQTVNGQLQALLGGVQVALSVSPPGAANDAATSVELAATDATGRFGQLDQPSRQAAASGALVLLGQYYPNANLTLTVRDPAGVTLISGSRAPGQAPRLQ
jgi:hypothetical protein